MVEEGLPEEEEEDAGLDAHELAKERKDKERGVGSSSSEDI